MDSRPRLLIVTAAFGEGHNSAAHSLAAAVVKAGAVARVVDPCMEGSPRATRATSRAYRIVTTYFPKIWAHLYELTGRFDFSKPRGPILRGPENALAAMMRDFRPDAVVSTYPLYPYFLERIQRDAGPGGRVPIFTVVTDSIEINAAWLRAPSDRWLVTDPHTRRVMIGTGLGDDLVVETGFPVDPRFESLVPVDADDGCAPFRVLYFATAKRPFVRRHGRAILEASPDVKLTVVMGRNTRLLNARVRELRAAHPGRVRLIGWTNKVPELMNQHHLVVGKAGGATVHEAIAARCPMLIHHLVPGQEEGNLELLRRIGAGELAGTPDALRRRLADLLADDAAAWRGMKQALVRHDRISGGSAAAGYILGYLRNPKLATPAASP